MKDWSWTDPTAGELRIMRLPDRKAVYLVLVDEDGLQCVARTLGDREAVALASWLDAVVRPVDGGRFQP